MATGKVVPLNQPYPAQKPDVVTTFDHLTASAISARTNPDSLVGQRGLAIYSKMANDEQVKAVTTFKRDAITARGWQFAFRPSTKLSQQEQEQRQGLFEEMLARMHGNFSDALNTIMTGRLFGFSMTEKVYGEMEVDGKQWPAINRLLGRDPLSFRFYTDEFGMLVRTEQQTRNGLQDVDMRRVIHYVHAPEWDQVYGRSDLREAYRSWYIKDQVSNLWPLYLERFAAGFVHVELPAGETLADEELTALKAAVTRVKSLGSLVTPPGVKVTVVFPGTTDAYESAVQFHDLAIAKALLVPNLLGISHTGQTGAYSQSQTQLEAFFWTLNADATRLEECLNEQLFRDLGDQCWGDGDYPVFRFKPASLEHTKWVLGTWKDLLGVKAVVPTEEDEAFIRKLMEMPARDEKSTPLVNPVEEQHRKEDMKAQADALAQTLEAKKQQPAPGKQTFAWDESKHPRRAKGSGDVTGDGKGDGGKFAPGEGVTLPKALYDELVIHEVDTHDPETASPERTALVEQLRAGRKVHGEVALARLRSALDNIADIAEDNGRTSLRNAAAKLRDSIALRDKPVTGQLSTLGGIGTGRPGQRLRGPFGGGKKFSVSFTTPEEQAEWCAALRVGTVLELPEAVLFTTATYDGIGVEVLLPGCDAEHLPPGTKLRMTAVGEGVLEAEVLPA